MGKNNNFYTNILSNPEVYKDAYFDIPDVNHWKPGWEANSLGYRGEPFENYAPILASGCSFTYGQGVRPEGTWPAQLAGMLDLSHHNLGVPGSGVGYQVGNIFSYIYKYGNPKIILCLFPEFNRMRMISNRNFMVPGNDTKKEYLKDKNDIIDFSYAYANIYDVTAISKIPHQAQQVIPQELAINISINYIKMLEMYCNSNGIILLWSTWNSEQLNYISNNINMMSFKNFIKVDVDKWHSDKIDNYRDTFHLEEDENRCRSHDEECASYTDCHSDLREIYGKNFDYTEDIDKAPSHHWGAHRQRHIAETFLKGINEYNTRN